MASEGDEQMILEKHSQNQLLEEKNADELSPSKVISCSPRKRQRVQGKKICQVCGDKALAHHFGALACETCKAFFRRNAVRPQETRKCVFQGNCCVDKNTRRFCPACRLKKCYHVGMRPELILGEEEKQARLKKAKKGIDEGKHVQNKAQVINDLSSQNIDSTSGQTTTTSPERSFWPGIASPVKQTVLLKSNSPGDCHQERLYLNSIGRSSTPSQHLPFETPADVRHWVQEPSPDGTVNVQAFETGHSVGFNTSLVSTPLMSDASTHGNNSLSSFLGKSQPTASVLSSHIHALHQHVNGKSQKLSKPTALSSLPVSASFPLPPHSDFQHVARDRIPSDPFIFWRLTEEERSLLAHLSSVYQDTVLSILQMNPPKESVPLHLLTKELCIEEHEGQIRSVISFVKCLQDFRQLSIDDQIALLKASNDPVLSLRACALYVSEKEAWLCNYGYVTQEHERHIFPDNPYIDHTAQLCTAVKKIVKNDTTLYALLHCVILFDPNDERITDRQSVNMIRGKFLTLLRHYLESVYSYRHSDRYMLVLQELLLYLRDLCHESRHLMKKVFPNISNELLVELYDLNQ